MGGDLEQRAVACFTLARCIIVAEGSNSECLSSKIRTRSDIFLAAALLEAVPYLQTAEADFRTLEMYRALKDVQYMLSVVYHNAGMIQQRDDAAVSQLKTGELQEALEGITYDQTYQDILQVVAKVGSALASRT